jgi:exodeoxyribonuclease V gamma subunit
VHSCHGPAREVEVLHDQLLRLFDQHADLTPEDVVVMAPDIDVYVPHVESVFGRPVAPTSGRGKGRHRVPFNLGGRRARTASAPANALLALLDLLAGRFGAAELLDFVDLASVKRGAGLATVDAQTLRTWLERAGVRWGVDGADRAACVPGLPPLNEASLEAGLDRLFLGLAMEQDATALTCYRGVFPAEGMEGNAHAALGAFADLCEALIRLRRDSRAPRPMADWHAWLEGAVDALMAPGLAAEDAWALRQALHGWAQAAAAAGFTGAVGLRAVARSLETALDARSSNTPGQGGGVTFNSLGTLSQLPFRVVALLGLGDDFPRRDTPLGFDPLATAPTGVDPARRQDDRGHVLHALRCARDVLILSYPGQSTATGEALPPSVTLAELLDNLAARYPSSEPKRWSFRDALVTRHRLHPFDPAYFGGALPPNNDDTPAGGPLVSHAPLFSYAEHFMSSAAAMAGAQQDGAQQDGANQDGTTPGSRPVFLSAALPPELADGAAPGGPAQVQLEDLIRVLKDPTKEFLKRALELTEPELQGALPERERFDFEQGLENWTEMTRLIELARRGVTRETAWEALTAAGELPLGAPGLAFFNDKWDVAAPFAEEALSQGGVRQPPEAHEVVIGGTRLTGALADLGKQPEGTVTHGKVTFSSAKKKEEGFAGFDVEMWVRHLFAQVTHGPIETWTIKKVKDSPMVASFPVLPKPAATAALEGLLEVYAMAQRAPLPLFPMAFPDVGAEATGDAHERLDAARSRYHKQDFSAGRAPKDTWENALVWSDRDPFDPAFEAIAGEPRSTTLELAERVYGPLRDARPGDKA